MTKDPKKATPGLGFGLLQKVLNLISDHRPIFYLSVLLTLMSAFLSPAIPWIILRIIDDTIVKQNREALFSLSAVMLGLLLGQTLVNYFQTYLTNILGQLAIKELRGRVFNHILRYKMQVFDRTPIGTLITRTVSDVEKVADIFAQGLINILGDLLQMIIFIIMMFTISWKLSLVVLAVFPLIIASGWIFKEAVKVSFNDVRNQIARLNTFLQEHITGMQVIQLFSRQKTELGRFKDISRDELNANLKAVMSYSVFFPAIEILSAISVAGLIWFGTKEVLAETGITFGVVTSFILIIERLFRPIRQIADKFNTLQMGLVASDRVFKLLDDERFANDSGAIESGTIKGEIEFKQVKFAYEGEHWILKGIDMHVRQGKMLAIVGATGSGKTTIINLINRLYDINSGEIKLDGKNIQDYKMRWLRTNIAVVLQDVFLFSDTIYNNITLHNPMITREKLIETSKLVGAHGFIEQLPGGYDYVVQERGATLSTGQRQLISFIRALVYDPKVLILDEATSSVDNETEELLQHAISIMLKGRTSIVIAHRLSTIQKADEILVMEKGEIKERGNHDSLLKQGGLYHKLYELQFAELLA